MQKLSTGKIIGLVVLALLIILALWTGGTYNSLITLDENAKTAQADVEAQYQRRYDLIPNLVSAVQGTMQQERAIFDKLAEARTRYAGAASRSPEKIAAMNEMETSLSRLLVVMENYPTLKSAENVNTLMAQLEGTENRISVARTNFNAVVNELNIKINKFPSNIIAKLFNFAERERFKATEQAAEAPPRVQFEFK